MATTVEQEESEKDNERRERGRERERKRERERWAGEREKITATRQILVPFNVFRHSLDNCLSRKSLSMEIERCQFFISTSAKENVKSVQLDAMSV